MSLLNAADLSFQYPSQSDPLFLKVSFEINPGDRIGLVGPNGAGKSTLLRILSGELEAHSGAIARRQQLRVRYVPQESSAAGEEALGTYVLGANPGLAEIHHEIRRLESQLDDDERACSYAGLLSAFEEQGGFRLEAEAEKVLDGLGFRSRERELPMAHLSSGQRALAELAKLLLAPTDLLLIDEPTNHLDIGAREWLEEYLARLDVAYLVVSHDRAFLNRATTRTFELRRQALVVYEGNYDFYADQRALRESQAWERFTVRERRAVAARRAAERRLALARRVAKPPRGIRASKDFYAHKAAKVARTARILRGRVVRQPAVEKPWLEDPIPSLDFPNVARRSGVALRVEGLCKAFDGKVLFQNLSFYVQSGARWAILGPNGCGKSTLLRILLGQETADAGTAQFGAKIRPGYYAQEGENLDGARSPLELCLEVHPDETWVRTILGCLRLRGEEATHALKKMSAGERAKVALARLLVSGADFLLLDELTNHLDIETREAVEDALLRFPGTILFVSHDRYFVKNLADEILDLSPTL
ncbi:MAG: ribosomal protection-like ABC-F family protein [Terriglobia bacterium]|jgi:ATP-binding cassette subfamily F protein 3